MNVFQQPDPNAMFGGTNIDAANLTGAVPGQQTPLAQATSPPQQPAQQYDHAAAWNAYVNAVQQPQQPDQTPAQQPGMQYFSQNPGQQPQPGQATPPGGEAMSVQDYIFQQREAARNAQQQMPVQQPQYPPQPQVPVQTQYGQPPQQQFQVPQQQVPVQQQFMPGQQAPQQQQPQLGYTPDQVEQLRANHEELLDRYDALVEAIRTQYLNSQNGQQQNPFPAMAPQQQMVAQPGQYPSAPGQQPQQMTPLQMDPAKLATARSVIEQAVPGISNLQQQIGTIAQQLQQITAGQQQIQQQQTTGMQNQIQQRFNTLLTGYDPKVSHSVELMVNSLLYDGGMNERRLLGGDLSVVDDVTNGVLKDFVSQYIPKARPPQPTVPQMVPPMLMGSQGLSPVTSANASIQDLLQRVKGKHPQEALQIAGNAAFDMFSREADMRQSVNGMGSMIPPMQQL